MLKIVLELWSLSKIKTSKFLLIQGAYDEIEKTNELIKKTSKTTPKIGKKAFFNLVQTKR